MKKQFVFVLVFVIIALILVGCATPTPTSIPPTTTPAPPTATSIPPSPTPIPPTATSTPIPPTATPTKPPTATASPTPSGLPPEPRVVKVQTTEGQATLDGMFFPAATKGAPIIVLMHWASGDQSDWIEIAYWLQNRGLGGKTPNPKKYTWLDSFWFPPVPKGQSLNVMTFTFRGCDASGCKQFNNRNGWIDANSAMKTAATLEGVDPQRIIAAGASIGADGAVDGCFWLNAAPKDIAGNGKCLGAFSLSPGSYLTVPYSEAVKPLQTEQPPKPVWCLYADQDRESNPACKSAAGNAYRAIQFPGNLHGMQLIAPTVDPKTLQLMLDWIKTSLGIK